MATLVIKALPEDLHNRLRRLAAAHRRSVTQETIFLLELALQSQSDSEARIEEEKSSASISADYPYWKHRKLLPEYEAMLNSGALQGGTDSTAMLSEERDVR
jgi:plasmid stability protein